VKKSVHSYWPVVERDIAQKDGGGKTMPRPFRSDCKELAGVYCRKVGYAQFKPDYYNGRVTPLLERHLPRMQNCPQHPCTVAGLSPYEGKIKILP
jgi:hypothetical protein